MNKKRFTIAQHKAMGERLKRLQTELTEISNEISSTYGWSSRPGISAGNMARAKRAKMTPLRKLQCALDKVLLQDVIDQTSQLEVLKNWDEYSDIYLS